MKINNLIDHFHHLKNLILQFLLNLLVHYLTLLQHSPILKLLHFIDLAFRFFLFQIMHTRIKLSLNH